MTSLSRNFCIKLVIPLLALCTVAITATAVRASLLDRGDLEITDTLLRVANENPKNAYEVLKKIQSLFTSFDRQCSIYLESHGQTKKEGEALLRGLHLNLNLIENAYLVNFRWMNSFLRTRISGRIAETRRNLDRVSFYVQHSEFETAATQKKYWVSYMRDQARQGTYLANMLEAPIYLLGKAL